MSEPSSKLPNLNTETEEFITKIESEAAAPLYELSPIEARNFLLTIQEESLHKEIDADIHDKKIALDNADALRKCQHSFCQLLTLFLPAGSLLQ